MTTISTSTDHPAPAAQSTIVIAAAWLGTLLLSRLPQIILIELGIISSSGWSLWWWIIIGAALFSSPSLLRCIILI